MLRIIITSNNKEDDTITNMIDDNIINILLPLT